MATLLQIVAPLVWPSVARTLVFSIVALVAPFGCGDARAAPVVAPGKAGVAAASPGPAPSVRAAEPLWPPISNLSPAL